MYVVYIEDELRITLLSAAIFRGIRFSYYRHLIRMAGWPVGNGVIPGFFLIHGFASDGWGRKVGHSARLLRFFAYMETSGLESDPMTHIFGVFLIH